MRTIIIGAGKVGFNIAQILVRENHDVVVIEKDIERTKIVEDNLDVQVVHGSGASTSVLVEAGIDEADMVVAVTQSDELNMIACLIAKNHNVCRTVARIRDPEYVSESGDISKNFLNIDLVTNPEKVTAERINECINVPEALDIAYFAKRQVQMLELPVKKGNPVIGSMLSEIKTAERFVVFGIKRKEELIIPDGFARIEEGDMLFVIAKTSDMVKIEKDLGFARVKSKNIMILGANRISYYLATQLEKTSMSVKIIEKDEKKSIDIAQKLDKTVVLNGDAADLDLLREEGIDKVDMFVALTDDDKLNMLVCLLARKLGAKRTIAQIRRSDYLPFMDEIGIDIAVSPRLLTAENILKFIRSMNVLSVSLLDGMKAELLELEVTSRSSAAGRKIKDVKFPAGSIIGSILRNHRVIIPYGDSVLQEGDKVVIFALPDAVAKIEKLFPGMDS